jgi:cell division protein FtsZ
VDEAASRVRQEVDPEANIIVGATFDETLGDKVRVSIVASGMGRLSEPQPMPPPVDPRMMRARPQTSAPHGHAPQAQAPHAPQTQAPQPHAPRQDQSRGFPPPHDEDVQRRLSEAIGVAGDQGSPEQGARTRETWRAPGNVMIEEGFSHVAWPPQQAAQPVGQPQAGRPSEHFVPAPPVDLRRAGRRMPEVEDFPPVAQREYRAKAGYTPQTIPPLPSAPPVAEEAPRRGILQRIMGRGRREDLDDIPTGNAAPDPRRPEGSSPDDWWKAGDSQISDDEGQLGPLPEFFNRQRK